jgi:two-component system chemotaxis response regulator CheB
MFRSAVEAFEGRVLGLIMTGMGRDGTDGCGELKRRGGYVIAQHEDGCVVYGMPKAVIDEGLADRVLPLGKIGPAILRHLKRSRRE